ncbi:hypothetical protein ACWEXZ_10065 [Staphylococcus xylosus]|uniref:hypothetical protein n=1 Tax=Staphylococcus TaxID=1279 RepID=UPI002174F82F|nr:hypothetical protein [Staphylococcus xylosus]
MDLEIIHGNDLPKGKVIIQSHKHTEQLPEIIACIKQLSQKNYFLENIKTIFTISNIKILLVFV